MLPSQEAALQDWDLGLGPLDWDQSIRKIGFHGKTLPSNLGR
jgi:hypothetical protein